MRGRSRRFWVALAPLVLALAGSAAADGEKPVVQPPAESAKPGAGLTWVDGFAAGKAAAKERKTLMLVYVPSDGQPPEVTKEFDEKVFKDSRSGEIAARCVPVRIKVGDVRPPDVKAFLKRYEVQALPGIFVMNSDGHFLIRNMRRTVDSVLRSLTKAEDDEKLFPLLAKKTDNYSKGEYRRQLDVRMAWEELLMLLIPDVTDKPTVENLVQAARAYQHLGKIDEEKAMYATAVDKFPQDPGSGRWRMRLATMHLDAIDDQSTDFVNGMIKAMKPLARQFQAEGDLLSAAESHLVVGNYLARLGEGAFAEAEKEFDAVLELVTDKPCSSKALMGKATICWYHYDYAKCRELCKRVVSEFPDTGESWAAKGVIKDCDKKMNEPQEK